MKFICAVYVEYECKMNILILSLDVFMFGNDFQLRYIRIRFEGFSCKDSAKYSGS